MGVAVRFCTYCANYKVEEDFWYRAKFKNTGNCKECKKIINNKYVIRNKEKVIASKKKYVAENKEKISATNSKYYLKNKESIIVRTHKYYHSSKDKVKCRTRAENIKRGNRYYNLNKEEIKKQRAIYFQENKERMTKVIREYDRNNPKKLLARRCVYKALKTGELKKESCLACQVQDKKINNNNIDGHHTDYDRPLNVVWLCRKHHLQVHKIMNKNNL